MQKDVNHWRHRSARKCSKMRTYIYISSNNIPKGINGHYRKSFPSRRILRFVAFYGWPWALPLYSTAQNNIRRWQCLWLGWLHKRKQDTLFVQFYCEKILHTYHIIYAWDICCHSHLNGVYRTWEPSQLTLCKPRLLMIFHTTDTFANQILYDLCRWDSVCHVTIKNLVADGN